MSDTITVALISAAVSLVVSLLATTLKNRADLARALKDQEHGYAKALFEKRVEYYPELYAYLSGYSKVIRNGSQDADNLAEFKRRVDDWNNKHSLFFTRATSKYSSKFRYLLGTILSGNMTTGLSQDDWEKLRKLIGYFEDFLKAEIGIYAAKPVGNVDEFADAYKVIDELIDDANNKGDCPATAGSRLTSG